MRNTSQAIEQQEKNKIGENKNVASLYNILRLQLRTVFFDIKNILMILLIPMIILFGVGIMIPSHDLLVNAFGMSEIIIISITFAAVAFPLTGTTIYKNIKLSKGRDAIIFFGTLITCLITALFVFLFQLAIFSSLQTLGIVFRDNFALASIAPDSNLHIVWGYVNWGIIFYYFFMTFLITSSILMVVKALVADQKVFYSFIFIYFFMDLFWGGVLFSPFTEWYNGDWSQTVVDGEKQTMNFSTYISFLMPQYWLNQFAFYGFRTGALYNIPSDFTMIDPVTLKPALEIILQDGSEVWLTSGMHSLLYSFNYFQFTSSIRWNVSLVMPGVYIIFNFFLFLILDTIFKKRIF